MNRIIIDKIDYNLFNARIETSVDGGKTFCYCGNGHYFKTLEAAEAYKKKIELNKTEGAKQT